MNVKITLTVPFEEVPDNIGRILKDSADKAASIEDTLRYDISCDDIVEALHDIDSVRKKLASLDFLLEDCYNILSSYQQRLSGAVTEKVEHAETDQQR